jgi:hypothetical protein
MKKPFNINRILEAIEPYNDYIVWAIFIYIMYHGLQATTYFDKL